MNKIYLKVCAILCILFVSSCTVENSLFERIEEKNFTLEQARANFENNAEDLKLVSFLQSQNLNKARTKSDGETDWENIVPDWENAVSGQTESGIAFMVPISLSAQTKGRFNINYGKYHTYFFKDHEVKCYLVVEQTNEGEIRRFITTGIGSSTLINDPGQPFLYTGSRSHFNGLFIISDETGRALNTYFYNNGNRHELHIVTDTCNANNLKGMASIGVAISNFPVLTKGGGDGNTTSEEDWRYCNYCQTVSKWVLNEEGTYICPNCESSETQAGFYALYFPCTNCGKWPEHCTCWHQDHPQEPGSNSGNSICNKCGKIKGTPDKDGLDITNYCTCDKNEDSGSMNHGGSGHNVNNLNVYATDNIIESFSSQAGENTSLANCIAYLYNLFGIYLSEDDIYIYLRDYYMNKGYDTISACVMSANSLDNGIPFYDYHDFVSSLFSCFQFTGTVENIIAGGSVVLVYNQVDSINNALLLLGYTVDNFWIYYDPGSGCLREIESFIVDPNKAICIQSIN